MRISLGFIAPPMPNTASTPSPPLSGLRVLDFSELLPGPFFTQNLVELGAHVTKIERPPHGDSARRIAPGLFASVNRGKQSLMADLKNSEQANGILAHVADTDIVVEGFRPGVMKRLGFDYETLAAINPRIIYVSLSGFGQNGPLAMVPGHDINYLAASGVLALSGSDSALPSHGAGIPLADLCGAMYALSSTLAAVLQLQRTGEGQYLDVSLTDCATHWMNPRLGHFHEAGLHTLKQQREDILNKPAYGVFQSMDGRSISIAALEDHFWERLNNVLALDLCDARYQRHSERVADATLINLRVAERVGLMQAADVLELLKTADVPVAAVILPGELASNARNIRPALFTEDTPPSFARYPVAMQGMALPQPNADDS